MGRKVRRLAALIIALTLFAGTFSVSVFETRAAAKINLIYDGLNYACVFDPVYYAKTYPETQSSGHD